LKDRAFLASNQFLWWEHTKHDANKFVSAKEVMLAVVSLLSVTESADACN